MPDDEMTTTRPDAGSRRDRRDAAAVALADVPHEPGAPKPDPILVADVTLSLHDALPIRKSVV